MPYQEQIFPLTQEGLSNGFLGQMWEDSEDLLGGVLGTPRLWELTGIRDLPTTCCFTMRPLAESDVKQLREVPELAPFMDALDQARYFEPSGMITFELSTKILGLRRIIDIALHRVAHLTDGDVVFSLIHDGAVPQRVLQQASFVPGGSTEQSATIRAAKALEVILSGRAGQSDTIPFPRLIEIFSSS